MKFSLISFALKALILCLWDRKAKKDPETIRSILLAKPALTFIQKQQNELTILLLRLICKYNCITDVLVEVNIADSLFRNITDYKVTQRLNICDVDKKNALLYSVDSGFSYRYLKKN